MCRGTDRSIQWQGVLQTSHPETSPHNRLLPRCHQQSLPPPPPHRPRVSTAGEFAGAKSPPSAVIGRSSRSSSPRRPQFSVFGLVDWLRLFLVGGFQVAGASELGWIMGGKQEGRIFVGGLSWETTDRQLEDAFVRFGKILESQVGFPSIFLFCWHLLQCR